MPVWVTPEPLPMETIAASSCDLSKRRRLASHQYWSSLKSKFASAPVNGPS